MESCHRIKYNHGEQHLRSILLLCLGGSIWTRNRIYPLYQWSHAWFTRCSLPTNWGKLYLLGVYLATWCHRTNSHLYCGSGWISLAYRFFVPGELSRYQSFKKEGMVTIKLIFGVIPLFIIAAIIEGYITPAPWPHWTKYLFSALTLFALFLYLGRPFLKEGMIRTDHAQQN